MCWLQLQHLDIVMAVPTLELKAGSHYGRLQDQASRRLNAAMKALTTLRQVSGGARPATTPESPRDGMRVVSPFGFQVFHPDPLGERMQSDCLRVLHPTFEISVTDVEIRVEYPDLSATANSRSAAPSRSSSTWRGTGIV